MIFKICAHFFFRTSTDIGFLILYKSEFSTVIQSDEINFVE